MKRRKFLKKSTCIPLLTAANFSQSNHRVIIQKPVKWKDISKAFVRNKNVINLNTGSAGLISKSTEQYMQHCLNEICSTSPYKAAENWNPLFTNITNQLSTILGVENNEVALVNNTTEAINFMLQGYPFKKNDEVLAAEHDYPYVVNTLKNLEKIKSIKATIIKPDLQNCTKQELITFYKNAFSPNTKLLVLTYITHREGMVLPIKALTEIAHKNGTEVLVDAAHAYAHIPHNLKQLNCDYYATSLHKWLSAPYGNGLLFIKKDKIEKINPVISSYENEKESIKKFEHLGTRAFQNIVAIQPALDFFTNLGIDKKYDRLKYLTNYWMEQLSKLPNVKLITNTKHFDYGGIASFKVEQQSSKKIVQQLYDEYGIIAKSTGGKGWSAIRISTNVFVLEKHLDRFIQAIKTITQN